MANLKVDDLDNFHTFSKYGPEPLEFVKNDKFQGYSLFYHIFFHGYCLGSFQLELDKPEKAKLFLNGLDRPFVFPDIDVKHPKKKETSKAYHDGIKDDFTLRAELYQTGEIDEDELKGYLKNVLDSFFLGSPKYSVKTGLFRVFVTDNEETNNSDIFSSAHLSFKKLGVLEYRNIHIMLLLATAIFGLLSYFCIEPFVDLNELFLALAPLLPAFQLLRVKYYFGVFIFGSFALISDVPILDIEISHSIDQCIRSMILVALFAIMVFLKGIVLLIFNMKWWPNWLVNYVKKSEVDHQIVDELKWTKFHGD